MPRGSPASRRELWRPSIRGCGCRRWRRSRHPARGRRRPALRHAAAAASASASAKLMKSGRFTGMQIPSRQSGTYTAYTPPGKAKAHGRRSEKNLQTRAHALPEDRKFGGRTGSGGPGAKGGKPSFGRERKPGFAAASPRSGKSGSTARPRRGAAASPRPSSLATPQPANGRRAPNGRPIARASKARPLPANAPPGRIARARKGKTFTPRERAVQAARGQGFTSREASVSGGFTASAPPSRIAARPEGETFTPREDRTVQAA